MDGFQDYLLLHHQQMVTSVISDEQSDMNIDLQLFQEEENTEEKLEYNQPISIPYSSSTPVKENVVQQEDSGSKSSWDMEDISTESNVSSLIPTGKELVYLTYPVPIDQWVLVQDSLDLDNVSLDIKSPLTSAIPITSQYEFTSAVEDAFMQRHLELFPAYGILLHQLGLLDNLKVSKGPLKGSGLV